MTNLVIVDYGMGNLWSVKSAFSYLDTRPVISSDPKAVASADTLVLPGVGSFYKTMQVINDRGLGDAIKEAVLIRKRKILGICLGMQLMAESGNEDGNCAGLGFIPTKVDRFSPSELGNLKVPHIGFNHVHFSARSKLMNGISSPSDFYFVHSYKLMPDSLPGEKIVCTYGIDFLSAYEDENIFATQFHPEKSQTNGLRLLSNFLKL